MCENIRLKQISRSLPDQTKKKIGNFWDTTQVYILMHVIVLIIEHNEIEKATKCQHSW